MDQKQAKVWQKAEQKAFDAYMRGREEYSVKIKGYYDDKDFEDSVHDWWIMKAEEIIIEDRVVNNPFTYYRIPIEEFEGLKGYASLTWNRGKELTGAEKEVIIIDDSQLDKLWDELVDYVEVYE